MYLSECWEPSMPLVCVERWMETPDTASFIFQSQGDDGLPRHFEFKPGQFITLGVDINGQKEHRAYSISSLPKQDRLQLTVKRVDGGIVSNHLIDHFKLGDSAVALSPAGEFNSMDCQHGDKVVLISAGCGITPVMSMAKNWLENQPNIDINFIHVARDEDNLIYLKNLLELADKHPHFHLNVLLKNTTNSRFQQGRMDQDWLESLCPDLTQRTVFLCGPIGFMEDVKSYIEVTGFDMTHFYQESFTPALKPQNSDVTDEEQGEDTGVVSISVPDFGFSDSVDKGTALIDALEKGGIPVIAACRSGVCGSCKCKVKVGMVESSSTETLTPEEIEQGFVLACSSRALSDVEISLN
ncbi:hybrid-cluster NAD(P)-dependent oxidoreductase [Vibrio sp. Of7-15]|uniref:hybrid-cluster NAD(P)-dependent oxidoreductase n=1 Tax=Vibrio sp. Of7-15 TaxID=2724879 RepID=UPI001EF2695E|nr:hybrid-cluster NAD(P)-dependent oxidoreductase [Vibrio sp. Of7-15]MCG7495434.1 hybrid-cluster NAD(P)-dependent oxidoreductase [Vibrio sp. Of7-15]